MNIHFTQTKNPKSKAPLQAGNLPFGKIFTDHMFCANYNPADGWHNHRIVEYAPIELSPAASCLHYGQMLFEGMKAYKHPNGKIALFRPRENFERMNTGTRRMSMPQINVDDMLLALHKLLATDADWVPTTPGASLYIRPFMFATDAHLGVRPSDTYTFMIILSPVGAYYGAGGMQPVRIFVEQEYVRAVRGGTGFVKCAGNYAQSLLAQVNATNAGYNQVLWLDAIERKYIEEVGAMNIFFVLDGKVVTPKTSDSILDGITRKSILEILAERGADVSERRISLQEVIRASDAGVLNEAFGCGTAAVVTPISRLATKDVQMEIPEPVPGAITQSIYDELTGIQFGTREDSMGWVEFVG